MSELKACPKVIYLQACDECYETACLADNDVTWCIDPLDHANLDAGEGHETVYDEEKDEYQDYPQDMAYIRKDIYADLLHRVREAVGEIETMRENTRSADEDMGILKALVHLRKRFVEELED